MRRRRRKRMISNGSDGLLVLTPEGHDYNDDDCDDNGDDGDE